MRSVSLPIRPDSSATAMNRCGGTASALVVRPACQRLEADDAAAGQIEDRLEGQRDLVVLDRLPQIGLQPHLVGQLRTQRGVEQRVPCAAAGLGAVHRDVGVAQHFVGCLVADAAEGDADAGAGVDLGAVELERLAQRLLQPFGERQRASLRRRVCSIRIANSSPPRRPTMSVGRTWRTMRCATTTRNSSPALWPSVSLISLKRSKSRYITANPRVGSARQRSIAAARQSRKRARLRRPVRLS